jgi:pyruvate dehydrogenase E2 component (dihydrolipoamide acetyltransferase)
VARAEPPAVLKEIDAEESAEEEMLRASPIAKRIAREHGLNLAEIQGSGPGGRIVRRDVEKAIQAVEAAPPPARVREPAAEKPVVLPPLAWAPEEAAHWQTDGGVAPADSAFLCDARVQSRAVDAVAQRD